MSVQLAYSDDDSICHLQASGETTLPDLHIALARQIDRLPEAAEPRILIDLRRTVLEATRAEVAMFIAYLRQRLIPYLNDRAGSVAMLTGIDAEIESSPMYDTCAEVGVLTNETTRLSVVQSFDAARAALNTLPCTS